MQLNFVLSGINHTEFTRNEIIKDDETLQKLKSVIRSLDGRNGHKYSFLFNGWTEPAMGARLFEQYNDDVFELHSDSGGLQIVTRGMSITPERKEEVYRTQARLSDIAMSFDEIPVKLLSDRSTRSDVNNRVFDLDRFRDAAIQSGKNLRRQLEVFEEEGSSCKPLVICHGNDFETYQTWLNLVLEQVPSSWHERIGGISLGAAALGTGTLQDVDRFMIYSNLDTPECLQNQLHILGVGAVKRMLPFLYLYHNPHMMHDDLEVSYDSSTHTSGLSMAFYHKNGRLVNIGQTFNEKFYRVFNSIKSMGLWDDELTEQDVYDAVVIPQNWEAKYGKHGETYRRFRAISSFLFGSCLEFTGEIDACVRDASVLDSYLDKKTQPLRLLKDISDWKEYCEWRDMYGRKLKSSAVKREGDATNLEDFFS